MTAKKTSKATTKATTKLPYVIVRCYGAGVHAGELVRHDRKGYVELRNSRRIWHWEGAASLSELAVYGSSNPSGCRFAAKLERVELLDAKEIDYCQPDGEKQIREQPEWRAQ